MSRRPKKCTYSANKNVKELKRREVPKLPRSISKLSPFAAITVIIDLLTLTLTGLETTYQKKKKKKKKNSSGNISVTQLCSPVDPQNAPVSPTRVCVCPRDEGPGQS